MLFIIKEILTNIRSLFRWYYSICKNLDREVQIQINKIEQ